MVENKSAERIRPAEDKKSYSDEHINDIQVFLMKELALKFGGGENPEAKQKILDKEMICSVFVDFNRPKGTYDGLKFTGLTDGTEEDIKRASNDIHEREESEVKGESLEETTQVVSNVQDTFITPLYKQSLEVSNTLPENHLPLVVVLETETDLQMRVEFLSYPISLFNVSDSMANAALSIMESVLENAAVVDTDENGEIIP